MALNRSKITVIGAGNVGATTAQRIAERDYADVVLIDIVDGLPQGKGLDLNEAGPVVGYEPNITGTNGYEESAGSDVVVITSGIARKPGMSRDDLLNTNMKIVADVAKKAVEVSPDAIFVIVSNPLDAMCHAALEATGLPSERVVGMAGILDSARFRTFLAWEMGVSDRDVTGFVMGGHGDTMVPVVSNTNVAGIPVTELIKPDRLAEIVQRTRDGGAEVVKFLKTGSAYYAPSAATAEMVDAIVLDQKRVLPCAAYLTGQYGVNNLYLGVPVLLGKGGVERIFEVELTDAEKSDLASSADAVRELVEVMSNATATA
jgi:malate dehydrogenase